jgi:hypothetical protein
MQLHRAALERFDGDFGEREEVALGGVQHVGDAAAIAIAGERERAFDPVALGLDLDALLAVVHVRLVCLGWGICGAHEVIIAAGASAACVPLTDHQVLARRRNVDQRVTA